MQRLNKSFRDRVWFVGLQGSYGRGEATETSDIDIVVILDELLLLIDDVAVNRAIKIGACNIFHGCVHNKDILALQKLAYKAEAEIYGDYSIPPLLQTLDELTEETKKSIILKYIDNGKIVGSVRAFKKDGTCYIGKLIVHPDYQNKGIGKKLMAAIEKHFEGLCYELFTGHLSEKNLTIYEKLGYVGLKQKKYMTD